MFQWILPDNRVIPEHTGFIQLPFPSNLYKSGQLIEVFKEPPKVEVTYDPKIPSVHFISSPGWDIRSSRAAKIKTGLSAEIQKIITAKAISQCKRCDSEITKGVKCFEVPKIGAGFSSKKRYCLKCFRDIFNQTKKDMCNLEDLLNEKQ